MSRYAVVLTGLCLAIAPAGGAAVELSRSASGLAYEVTGTGPSVVLIHGSNLDHRLWDGETELLRGSFRVLRYDLRGHGQSGIPTEPFSAVEDLAGLLDELEREVDALVIVERRPDAVGLERRQKGSQRKQVRAVRSVQVRHGSSALSVGPYQMERDVVSGGGWKSREGSACRLRTSIPLHEGR